MRLKFVYDINKYCKVVKIDQFITLDNINILFECFTENKNYVQKIKLFDDKNNMFIAMCSTELVYESLFSS